MAGRPKSCVAKNYANGLSPGKEASPLAPKSVVRHVLEHTYHTLLVGEGAGDFANSMGFQTQSLNTPETTEISENWTANNWQSYFCGNAYPDPLSSYGPYKPLTSWDEDASGTGHHEIGVDNHDTTTMVAIDVDGKILVGTSTNGLRHRLPGRVGDASNPGSGAYAKVVGGLLIAQVYL
ncbi:putative N(4)-(beta-N-acetylglucosaminyl)-L-asparaginase GD10667 [Drosophila biarmipes]|uniref:putative N(4)-(beta-N-acetylglucosaminyl)-L-asparaginase GD10667 n=1 Tax=Drosophila biarmipes TaxID=125945 RepID=UPI0007E6E09C|nr:putative N(4)-(beta-N-acetylglucosaminyl)-L-asparaginase GD10667 [Drosophila biarmipes]